MRRSVGLGSLEGVSFYKERGTVRACRLSTNGHRAAYLECTRQPKNPTWPRRPPASQRDYAGRRQHGRCQGHERGDGPPALPAGRGRQDAREGAAVAHGVVVRRAEAVEARALEAGRGGPGVEEEELHLDVGRQAGQRVDGDVVVAVAPLGLRVGGGPLGRAPRQLEGLSRTPRRP